MPITTVSNPNFVSADTIFFEIILFLSPISGDDWGNYLVGQTGLYHSIGNAIGMYFDWEGRFVSRILINILTYHKILWNIINALALTITIYYLKKLINPHNKKMSFLLVLFIILFMNIYTFSQVIVWLAGNITYTLVIPLLLYYLDIVINKKDNTKLNIILIFLLNLIIPMFIEHMAIILVLINLYIIIKELKNKKINKKYLLYFIISLLSFTIMFISPGSLKRASIENIEFNNLSLIGKILSNIPNFIYYTFITNFYTILLMIIANYYLIKNNIKNKAFKILSYFFFLLPPLIITINYLSNSLNYHFLNNLNQNNILVQGYFIIYIIFDLFMIISVFKQKSYLYILGILANLIMLLSPTWGYRTSFFTYIFLSLAFIMIIDKYYKEKRIINVILFIIAIITFSFYIFLYINVYRANIEREKDIKRQINNDIIEIERFPYFINCNINPENEYHLTKFKDYYKIDQSKEIKLIDGNWKYKIIYKK